MKCEGKCEDGSPCNFVFKGERFCPECGFEKAAWAETVPCPGQQGAPCGAPLQPQKTFCSHCGSKIDPAWFGSTQQVRCNQPLSDGSLCSNSLSQGDRICSKCLMLIPRNENQGKDQVQKEVTEPSQSRRTDEQHAEKLAMQGSSEPSADLPPHTESKAGDPCGQGHAPHGGGASTSSEVGLNVLAAPYIFQQPSDKDKRSQHEKTEPTNVEAVQTALSSLNLTPEEQGSPLRGEAHGRVEGASSNPPASFLTREAKENQGLHVSHIQETAGDPLKTRIWTVQEIQPVLMSLLRIASQSPLRGSTPGAFDRVSGKLSYFSQNGQPGDANKDEWNSNVQSNISVSSPESGASRIEGKQADVPSSTVALKTPTQETSGESEKHDSSPKDAPMNEAQDLKISDKPEAIGKDSAVTSLTGEQDSNNATASGEHLTADMSQDGGTSTTSHEENNSATGASSDFVFGEATRMPGDQHPSADSPLTNDGDDKSDSSADDSDQSDASEGKKEHMDGEPGADADNKNNNFPDGDKGKFYRKSAQNKNASHGRRKKKSREKKAKKKTPQQDNHDPDVDVVFHVLISKDFKLTDKKQPCIAIGDTRMGEWDKKWEMKVIRKFGPHTEVQQTISMPKSLRNKGFEYKYCLQKQKKTDSMDKKCTYECVYTKQTSWMRNPNRVFSMQKENFQSLDVWHQYDGMAYPEKSETLWESVKKLFSNSILEKIRSDVVEAAECFFPCMKSLHSLTNLDDAQLTAEDTLKDIDVVLTTLRKQMVSLRQAYTDEKLVQKCIELHILTPLVDMMKNLRDEGKTSSQLDAKKSGVIIGIMYLLILHKYSIPLSQQTVPIVFRALAFQYNEEHVCPEMEAVCRHFPSHIKNLHKVLLGMVKKHMAILTAEADVIWLHCIPLVHFLRQDSKPYTAPTSDVHHCTPEFWGVHGFVEVVEKVKWKHAHGGQWIPPLEKMLAEVLPTFEVDLLMPRTFMALLNLRQLPQIISTSQFPPDVCAACMVFHWKQPYLFEDDLKTLEQCHSTLKNVLTRWIEEHCEKSETPRSDTENMAYLQRLVNTLQDLLEIVTNITLWIKNHRFVGTTFSMLILCLETRAKLEQKLYGDRKAETVTILEGWIGSIISWLRRTYSVNHAIQGEFSHVVKVWSAFADIVQSSKLLGPWADELGEAFEYDALQIYPNTCFRYLCEENLSKLCDIIQARVQNVLFKSFEKMMSAGNTYSGQWNPSRKTGELMSRLLKQHWPKDESCLEFILTWMPIVLCLEKFYGHEEAKYLSEECQCQVTQIIARIDSAVTALRTGDIAIADLKLMRKKHQSFQSVLMAAEKSKGEDATGHVEQLMKLLEAREEEVTAFHLHMQQVDSLLKLCQHFPKSESNALMSKFGDFEGGKKSHLNEICTPREEDVILSQRSEPVVNPLELPDGVLEVLPALHKWQASGLFMSMWCREAKQCQERDLFPAMLGVWKKVSTRWSSFCKQVREGSITFLEMDRHLRVFEGDEATIQKEFQLMEDDGKSATWMQERLKQMHQYHTIQNCQSGAKAIIDLKNEFGIEGHFVPVQKVVRLGLDKNVKMNHLNRTVLTICKDLVDITPDQIACLRMLQNSKELLQWLKESLPGGLKELKVFVDLAFISAGEGDMEIDKVNCFHAAVTGYAPLIFDISEDSDYKAFLGKCRLVWRELESDRNLPQKLESTRLQLPWLKVVRQSHGSVEVKALTQAKVINERGIYRVGNLSKTSDPPSPSLEGVMNLRVGPDSSQALEGRDYSHRQLIDLQSRLMLVAGQAEKGKDNVERFTLVLDGIIRLARAYITLCSDGCVLFNSWRAKFLCDETRSLCTLVEFGLGKNRESLKAQRGSETLDTFIMALAGCLEQFHEEWTEYVRSKRESYTELNYFTVQQLVYLQQELIKVGPDSAPHPQVFSLLSLVLPGCCQQRLYQAMQEAQAEVDGISQDLSEEEDGSPEDELPAEHQEEVFIQNLMESGFPRSLALAALEHVDASDLDEGLVWCMEQDEVEEMETEAVVDSPSMPQVAPPVYQGWHTSGDSVAASATSWVKALSKEDREGVSVETLRGSLQNVWTKFLEAVSSSVADYLSLEHLAIVLRKLAQMSTEEICRSLPATLKKSTPNLIVCPQADVLKTVLHMYMHSPEQPLPRPDEVLLCTSSTTFDQIDVFLRRAFFTSEGKLHSLVSADCLDYDVGEKTEKKLKEYMAKTGDDYQLMVVCSAENEYRARIVAALERYRCPPPVVSEGLIRAYLQRKFASKSRSNGVTSASHVDFAGSTVRVVKSKRAGVGKTLFKRRLVEQLETLNQQAWRRHPHTVCVSIPLYERKVCVHSTVEALLQHTHLPEEDRARIFHLDISYDVQEGVDAFLFNLLVLGCVTSDAGHVWLRSPMDLYIVETIPLVDLDRHSSSWLLHESVDTGVLQQGVSHLMHAMLEVLPDVRCWSPQESAQIMGNPQIQEEYKNDQLFDEQEFLSDVYQRPYQYLKRFDENQPLTDVDASEPEGSTADCLGVLLRHCGIPDPSWAELRHFVWFLNTQLADFERSSFCGAAAAEDLPGFAKFLLRFLYQMSRDFATRSLNMREESPLASRAAEEAEGNDGDDAALQLFQMRRTWESSPHPYIFFNPDGHSMTFLGFNIDRGTGNLVDQQTGAVLERAIMEKPLQESLRRNRVPLYENFDALDRISRVAKLASVIGLEYAFDPDETYELTTDNVKKMMAIYMRFRCGIPVIIMGETGCGKTRLVKFLCQLQSPPGVSVENMVLMKVHGGTTAADIMRKVHHAEQLARRNAEEYGAHMYTVLFFDEANTTEAIGLIKEILCDGTMNGQPLVLSQNLKMVAACNPYRKHSEDLIRRLEKAGLGYHVDAEQTADRLGRVPMRRLVYRVQPLPQSMLPLVWDFGQLNSDVEEKYIRQMVNRYVRNDRLPNQPGLVEVLSEILIGAQDFMRERKDECSFVSLRDVDRMLQVMSWFLEKAEEDRALFDFIDPPQLGDEEEEELEEEGDDETDQEEYSIDRLPDDLTKSAILALAVCYRACLHTREDFDEMISDRFQAPFLLPSGVDDFCLVIDRAQECFMDNVQLEENIARNHALSENVFMMVVCMELRIPLFLVGKPGSSKSLAKTIVADAMQGNSSRHALFKSLKQTHMVSFQCSPLSTADGILGTFRQCAQIQKDKNLETFVSVVVLDEVGLAEDSPRMPLKTLHPLLEDGCQGDEDPEPYKKVAFIGISNWALDPAKMNRGILVQREVPDEEELVHSAKGICSQREVVRQKIEFLIKPLATGYLNIFEATRAKREFFGLRDFYSLVKMIYGFAAKSGRPICWPQLVHSIRRNFGGLDHVDPVEIFSSEIAIHKEEEKCHADDPDCNAAKLIEAGLFGDDLQSDSRYLLLLTENYGALNILQQQIFAPQGPQDALGRRRVVPQTIFGSSFPKDQEYTQICRNINKIKVCMEMGHTVILLNLDNLYESLYDALNQYYARLGGAKYVDLGLGSHRVKCRVHDDFRLIVVAEKQVVYDKFPIPLINRLEKHFLTLSNLMTPLQLHIAQELLEWARKFSTPKHPQLQYQRQCQKPKAGDVFMGFHPDAAAALVLQMWDPRVDSGQDTERVLAEISRKCQQALLECATPDAVLRLATSQLSAEVQDISETYFQKQHHDSLLQYLRHRIIHQEEDHFFAQVTTHSKLLTDGERLEMAESLRLESKSTVLLTLQSFDTEQQFSQQIRNIRDMPSAGSKLLLVQCNSGNRHVDLIKCAQYCVVDALPLHLHSFFVVFIIQLPRIAGDCFSGFQAGRWHSLHIDDLYQPSQSLPDLLALRHCRPSALLHRENLEPGDAAWNASEETSSRLSSDAEAMETETEEGVRLEDVHLQEAMLPLEARLLEGLGGRGEEGQACFSTESYRQLVLSCLQAAVALVQDPDPQAPRSTQRIDLLLSLISMDAPADTPSFLGGIFRLISRLLQEKEDAVIGQAGAREWLVTEAARPDLVKKAGTFRRAWMLCLETKVTPILGGIVAFLDTNRNLDLVVEGPEWQRTLWLAVLNSPETCGLRYASLTSPQAGREATQMALQATSTHGGSFAARLPFSWLLLQPLQTLFSQSLDMDEQLDTFESSVVNLPYCQLLLSVAEGFEREVVKAYVRDFIHTNYKMQSEDGYALLCEALMAACGQREVDLFSMPLPGALVSLHWVHSQAEARLRNFLLIQQLWAPVVPAILEQSNKSLWQQAEPPLTVLLCTEELTVDVLGLCLLLGELEPSKEQLNRAEGRQRWLEHVTKYSPTITAILNTMEDMTLECGNRCRIFINKARCLWTRVLAMKLFVDHFFPANATSLELRCMPLWGFLGPDADLKTCKSLEKVEKFLKTANKEILKKAVGRLPKCPECDSETEAPLVSLPCRHKICLRCFQDLQILQELTCPKCQEPIPADFQGRESGSTQGEQTRFELYQQRCNSFLVALVAKLCFGGNATPEPEAVEKILGYVIRKSTKQDAMQTKQLTLFDNLVDPSPVVRSFLLQLLIRKKKEDTEKHLAEFFDQASRHCRRRSETAAGDQEKNLREFALLVVHCLEDMYHESTPGDLLEQMEFVTEQLLEAREGLLRRAFDLAKLYTLAQSRHGLALAAQLLHRLEISQHAPLDPTGRQIYSDLLEATQALVELEVDWPKHFLLKQLCREFGVQSYYTLVENKRRDFSWLKMEDAVEVKQCPDRFLLCGDEYQRLRDVLSTLLLGEDISTLETAMEGLQAGQEELELGLLLALHRTVTMSYLHPGGHLQKTRAPALEALKGFITKCPHVTQKALAADLLANELGGPGSPLLIRPGQGLLEQSLLAWLLHFRLALAKGPKLLAPLAALAQHPETMQNVFLPTMPEDDVRKVHEMLLAARGTTQENPVLYRCPQGHPYIIGDCGRPAVRATCNVCGAAIGGEGYEIAAQNVKDEGIDRTERGHILGDPSQRPVQAIPERSLMPASCSLLRLLTHAALVLGAGADSQAVSTLTKAQLRAGEANVEAFFWKHLLKDVEVLGKALGKSTDDVISLLHALVHAMWRDRSAGHQQTGLASKEARNQWEVDMDAVFLTRAFKDADNIITTLNNAVAQDKNLGQDRLLCVLYEVGTPSANLRPDSIHLDPVVWRYRERVTVTHFLRQFDLLQQKSEGGVKNLEVLRLFKEKSQVLQVLQHVPSLLQFQRQLLVLFHRRLDRSEAQRLSIQDLLKDWEKWRHLVEVFCQVWEQVKGHLATYGCWTLQQGRVWLGTELRNLVLTPDSSCALFLPATRGQGLLAYVLTEFLLRQHNQFMDHYCSITHKKYSELPEVLVKNLTASHLVSFDTERDLLPLVLAHCNYSFQMGKGTQVDYDFQGFQRELIEQFLQSKSRIHQQHHIIPVETMAYRADTTTAIIFRSLRSRLDQVPLSQASRHQIRGQLPSLPDICQSLASLDVTISFLQTLGGDPEALLHTYMVDVLHLACHICSLKARQMCRLKHVQSLWLLLCLERAKILALHRQEVFDSLSAELLLELTPEQAVSVAEFCQNQTLSVEKLECLLQQLFDCILLRIAQPPTSQDEEEDEVDIGGQILRDILVSDLEGPLYADTENAERPPVAARDLDGFPGDITASHAAQVWLHFFQNIQDKKKHLQY